MRTMMSWCVLTVVLGTPVLGQQRQTEPNVSIDALIGYDLDVEEFLLGAGAGIPLRSVLIANHPLIIRPSFEIFPFIDNVTVWSLVGNLMFAFPLQSDPGFIPYAIGGLSIRRVSVDVSTPGGSFGFSSTDVFLDFGGGVAFGRSVFRTHPFAELEVRVGDESTGQLRGGVRIATR